MDHDDRDTQMQLSPVTYKWVRGFVMPRRVCDASTNDDDRDVQMQLCPVIYAQIRGIEMTRRVRDDL